MRAWCYNHPTVSFVAVFAFYLFVVWGTIDSFHDREWGWAAIGLLGGLSVQRWVIHWWKRT